MARSNTSDKPARRSVGRPSVLTTDVLLKLEHAFAIGASDKEACFYADINPDSLYQYQRKHPEYSERKEALKLRPILMARQKVMDDIGKDVNTAKWYLERKLKHEFSTKLDADITSNGETIQPLLVSFITKKQDVLPDGNNTDT